MHGKYSELTLCLQAVYYTKTELKISKQKLHKIKPRKGSHMKERGLHCTTVGL